MSKEFDIKGLDKLIKDLKALGDKGVQALGDVTEVIAEEIWQDAKTNVPVNNSFLKGSIGIRQINDLNYSIFASAPYSGFVEFGTGTKVDVPVEMQDVANEFRNVKIGDMNLFKQSLLDWMKKKGIDQKYLFPIMMSILRAGIRPHPFMYPAFVKGRANYVKALDTELQKLLNTL